MKTAKGRNFVGLHGMLMHACKDFHEGAIQQASILGGAQSILQQCAQSESCR